MRKPRFAICPRCEGHGTHTNPAVDSHGITEEEMCELGDDFREDYFSGVYDVRCERCMGERVVTACDECEAPRVPDPDYLHCYDHLPADERAEYNSLLDMYAMEAAERRVGA